MKAPTRTVSGELVEARGDVLTLRVPSNPALELRVDVTTAVVLDGKRAEPEALPEGSQVRASYREEADGPTALRVDATSKKQEAAPEEPDSEPR